MNNTIETKEHIMWWLERITKDLNDNSINLMDNVIYSKKEIDDNLLNEMIEQTIKLQAYLQKLRDGKYE